MDALEAAHRIVAEHFPTAEVALLAGSAATNRRTPTSDLDLVIILPGPPAPYRETIVALGWPVELFVHTRASLNFWWAKDAERRRCTLAHMCATGTILCDLAGDAGDIQVKARALVEAGPSPRPEEMDLRRYLVTALLDDFSGSDDEWETPIVVASLIIETCELALLSQGRWLGGGKWLARNFDPGTDLSRGLVLGQGSYLTNRDKGPLAQAVSAILERSGGPLREGYRVEGTITESS